MDSVIKKRLIESYQVDGGFIVHDRKMLEKIYTSLGIDPKTSLDTRIYELEGITHFFQHGVASLFKKLGITKDDFVLSLGEGSGAPSRLLIKMTGCHVVGIDINPAQIAKAKDLSLLHGVSDRVDYYNQNVAYLDLEKKDFTCAYVNETCGHWQEKDKAFKQIYAHVKTGAKIGFNAWLKGDKGTLNEADDCVPEFQNLYQRGIWFQDDLDTYEYLLEHAGFSVLEVYDCTNKIDIKMRTRLRAKAQWEKYEAAFGKKAAESGLNYYKGMLKTHYDYLRYGVIIAQKKDNQLTV